MCPYLEIRCCRCNQLRLGPTGIGWAPSVIGLVSLQIGDLWTQHTKNVEMNTEKGVMRLYVKEHHRLSEKHQEVEEKLGTDSPHSPQKDSTLLMPWSWTSNLHNCEAIHFCCVSPSTGYSSPIKRIQRLRNSKKYRLAHNSQSLTKSKVSSQNW